MLSKISRSSFYCGTALLLSLFNNSAFSGQTTRVNVASNGAQSNSVGYDSLYAHTSADGRYVTFTSPASNLVSGDNNDKADIFLHDRLTRKTERVSVTPRGKQANGRSINSTISADGRYIAFLSEASNLIANDNNKAMDVFVYDRLTKQTQLSSITSSGIGNSIDFSFAPSGSVSLSANGRYVAFARTNSDDSLCGFCGGIFVYDQLTRKTERISTGQNKNINANSMSADGRYVAFVSTAKKDEYNNNYVYVYDRLTGKTEQVSVVSGGKIVSYIAWNGYSLSANGRYVAFASSDPNRLGGSSNTRQDVFVYDRLTHKSERISKTSGSFEEFLTNSTTPTLSADGRYLAFSSDAPDLIPGDTNQSTDVFVYDRLIQKTELASVDSNGVQATYSFSSNDTTLSADGRYVVFASDASNLVAKDTNGGSDVFVRDRLLDITHRADLKISLTTKPSTLKPNKKGDYLYTITNNGKDTVNNVSLLHLVSGGSAISFKPSQGRCSPSNVETVCYLGKLAAGKKLTLRVTVKAQTKVFSQQVTVSGASVDSVLTNNYVTVSTSVK